MALSSLHRTGHGDRERVIRRIAQLNAEIRRLQHIAEESDGDADVAEIYRSVRRLRSSMAAEELTVKRAEVDLLGDRLAHLNGTAVPSLNGKYVADES